MTQPNFTQLLETAITTPGTISTAYGQFHDYSMGNMLLAMFQCAARAIPLGPIATYPRWQALGRQVKKGEKAIALCMPMTIKTKTDATATATDSPSEPGTFTKFIYRNNWFVLSQTDGEPLAPVTLPSWEQARALDTLQIAEIPFDHHDGNTMGYAKARQVAINPVNPHPHKTLFHELAHILLGHTAEGQDQTDDARTPRSLREVEAECVALLCCEALNLGGAAESRGYVQHWMGDGFTMPEKSAQKILKAADQILKAGRPAAVPAKE